MCMRMTNQHLSGKNVQLCNMRNPSAPVPSHVSLGPPPKKEKVCSLRRGMSILYKGDVRMRG